MKERQRQLREDAILDAARDLLSTKGFVAMTLEDVINEVGISKPTFYQHFVSKEELGIRVLVRAMQAAQAHLKSLDASLPPDQVFTALVSWLFDHHFGPERFSDFSGMLSIYYNDAVRQAESNLVLTLAAAAKRGQRAGAVRKDIASKLIAQTVHSILRDPTYLYEHSKGKFDVAGLKAGVTKLFTCP